MLRKNQNSTCAMQEATQEDLATIEEFYPILNLGDKIGSKRGGNIIWPTRLDEVEDISARVHDETKGKKVVKNMGMCVV